MYNENKNENIGSDEDGQNTELLERGEISATRRSENDIREYSKNTRTLKGLLGLSYEELQTNNIRAGHSGWLENYYGSHGFGDTNDKHAAGRFLQSNVRKLSGTRLKTTYTILNIM